MIKDRVSINVLEHTIYIKCVTPNELMLENNLLGTASNITGDIVLNTSMSIDVLQHTFMHELTHRIEAILGMRFKEREIDCIAIGMLSFIRNNPEVIQDLLNKE